MQALVVFDPMRKGSSAVDIAGQITVDGMQLAIGYTHSTPPFFDPESRDNYNSVLVEVLALSCNYRDRAIVLGYLRSTALTSPIHIGSEFVGIVREVGRRVASFAHGDRVIGNNAYPQASFRSVLPGVPTNVASARFLVLSECKIARVPDMMPEEVASGYSIAAQTCYAMSRKLEIVGGERCIITGASSNTGLFALSMLSSMRVETYALTTGSHSFASFGVAGTIRVRPPFERSISTNEVAQRIVRENGGADIVIDCFADIYAPSVLPLLRQGGKYIVCGVFGQGGIEPCSGPSSNTWRDWLAFIIMNNITFHGNCLGSESDLAKAIGDYPKQQASIPVDHVFGIDQGVEFVRRSFSAPDRFGKVIFRYSSKC